MHVKMSDEKQSSSEPTVVFTTSQGCGLESQPIKSRITKKHVLIAATILLITGLVVAAVLVSVRMVTDNNLDILKYTLQAKGVSQNVSVDKNVVSYHIVKDGTEAWIVDDFDKDIKITKVLAEGKTSCYVTALNRSRAADATSIPDTTPVDAEKAPSNGVMYQVMPDPISDISYLGKRASDMCQNIPTYHAVPHCGEPTESKDIGLQNTTAVDHRSKRTPAFCDYYPYGSYCPYPNCRCICGCCWRACAWFTSYSYILQYVRGSWQCTYFYKTGYLYSLQYLGSSRCYYSGRYYNP